METLCQNIELSTANLIAILSTLVALVAVITGPIVTFKVAKHQIISPIRQKWIDELRELMSEFLSECRKGIIVAEGTGILNTESTNNDLFQKILYLEQKLNLMLNPNEEDHTKLLEAVIEISDCLQHGVVNFIEFGTKVSVANDISQKILKNEWRRVKSGEI
jgi:hypothetical protein